MDADAKDDAASIVELLEDEGIRATLLDDSAPGVPEGVYEVRVTASDAARAEQLIAEDSFSGETEQADPSAALDLETIYHAESSATGEVEALGIRSLLESNGIAAVLVGDSVLPNLPFEVRVARDQVERAQALIAEAKSSGDPEAEG